MSDDQIMTWDEIFQSFFLMEKKQSPSEYTPAELEAMGSPTYVSPEGFITWD